MLREGASQNVDSPNELGKSIPFERQVNPCGKFEEPLKSLIPVRLEMTGNGLVQVEWTACFKSHFCLATAQPGEDLCLAQNHITLKLPKQLKNHGGLSMPKTKSLVELRQTLPWF